MTSQILSLNDFKVILKKTHHIFHKNDDSFYIDLPSVRRHLINKKAFISGSCPSHEYGSTINYPGDIDIFYTEWIDEITIRPPGMFDTHCSNCDNQHIFISAGTYWDSDQYTSTEPQQQDCIFCSYREHCPICFEDGDEGDLFSSSSSSSSSSFEDEDNHQQHRPRINIILPTYFHDNKSSFLSNMLGILEGFNMRLTITVTIYSELFDSFIVYRPLSNLIYNKIMHIEPRTWTPP